MSEGYQYLITHGAAADLIACRGNDSYAASVIARHLRELRGDPLRCANIVLEGYFDDEVEDVVQVYSLQRRRINAYRTKLVTIGFWRIITAVSHQTKQMAIMAIMPRSADYEANAALWDRIEDEYEQLGFQRLGR